MPTLILFVGVEVYLHDKGFADHVCSLQRQRTGEWCNAETLAERYQLFTADGTVSCRPSNKPSLIFVLIFLRCRLNRRFHPVSVRNRTHRGRATTQRMFLHLLCSCLADFVRAGYHPRQNANAIREYHQTLGAAFPQLASEEPRVWFSPARR